MSSAQLQIFVIARVFNIMQFGNMFQNVWIAFIIIIIVIIIIIIIIIIVIIIIIIVILIIIIIEPSTHCSFACLKSAIETLKQGVKSVQS